VETRDHFKNGAILKAIETVFATKGAVVVESNRMAFIVGRNFAEGYCNQ
jgi:hypothetical protein